MPHEREIKTLLGIPSHVHTAALVPVGHPRRKHGPSRRIPAAERTHRERWDGRWLDRRQASWRSDADPDPYRCPCG